ncbi:MAG: CocE/NonD family hydrolase [Acidimicrobiales bacterium]
MIPRWLAAAAASAVLATACSSTTPSSAGPTTTEAVTTSTESVEIIEVPVADYEIAPGSEQLTVTGAEPGRTLELQGGGGSHVGVVDEMGNLMFRAIAPADDYVVFDEEASEASPPVRVAAVDDHPDAGFYTDQDLVEGLNYIETRDGTTLAAYVRLPGPVEDGPYPTVIEYSGYDPANPDEPEPMTGVFSLLGYATVGVNMRGTGCSGGAFDYFEPVQSLDGYDAVETVAAQPWVFDNRVGMVGISYPGISQLFVAATRPPNLGAISPMSVIEDLYRSVLYPGGIYNDGFAKDWGDNRQAETEAFGQEWVGTAVDGGDEVCEANQLLRSQNVDLAAQAREAEFYDDDLDGLSPRTFVDRIEVPTFMAGAWQDEQTGSRFATMLDDFTGAEVFKVHLYNGAHADAAAPEVLSRLVEFMDVYIAQQDPVIDPAVRAGAPLLYQDVFGVAGLSLPDDRFATRDEALAAIESEPPVRLLLEMGGGEDVPGGPVSRGELLFDAWPPLEAEARTWQLAGPGDLIESSGGGEDIGNQTFAFTVDAAAAHVVTPAADDDANEFDNLSWPPLAEDNAVTFETEVFTDNALLAGSGVATLFVQSTAEDVDLQVTISEIRPDGQEMYVQSGWLRASHRAVNGAESTELVPFHTHSETEAAPLPEGAWAALDVEIFPVAHVFRAGSRLRLIVDSPGATRNLWTFDVLDTDGDTVAIGAGPEAPSSLSLPFVAGVELPSGLPGCGSTRSQPCRPAVPSGSAAG